MDPNRASITALVTAFSRAWHSENVASPVFDDFYAGRMITPQERSFLGQNLAALLPVLAPESAQSCTEPGAALAAVLRVHGPISLGRSRYAEACLDAAVGDGARQYVDLGAGFDTWALRRPEMLETLRVFEVDHPATQAFKRARMAEVGIQFPGGVTLVPVDFTREGLVEGLERTCFDKRAVTFFTWLGVTYYLPKAAVTRTFRSLAALAPAGSRLVFDCLDGDAFRPERASIAVRRLQEIARRTGEPMETGFDADELAEALAVAGFRVREHLTPGDVEERLFRGRADGYHAFDHVHLVLAERV